MRASRVCKSSAAWTNTIWSSRVFASDRRVVAAFRDDVGNDGTVFDVQIRAIVVGNGLHLGIFSEAHELQLADTAIARRADDLFHQLGRNTLI